MTKTILLVDDFRIQRQVVANTLREAGYAVVEALDGNDAVSRLGGQKVHLIVSDVHMPNMDGIAFINEVKRMPAYRFTPIIMLTTEASGDAMAAGKAAGAKAWLMKPFKPDQILAAVSKFILP